MATTAVAIRKHYNHCLDEAQRVLARLGFTLHQSNARVESRAEGSVAVLLNEPLYFENWPYRSEGRRRLDILAEVKETICLADSTCTKSSVFVNYFLIDGDARTACDAIKYDFDVDVQAQHPICHAQNTNKVMDSRPELFLFDVDQTSLEKRQQVVRIPTAFVNLAGLLAKIAADHLPKDSYIEFSSKCKPYVDSIPGHTQHDLFDGIKGSSGVRSQYWYPDTN